MYRMSAIAAGMRYEGVPLQRRLLARRGGARSRRSRATARAHLARLSRTIPPATCFRATRSCRVVDAAPGLVVVDEAYYPFSGGATLMDEVGRHPNLLLVRTVSKLGLAGLRLGLAAGPPEWMEELEKLRPPYNVNVLTAAAAELVLAQREVLEGQTRAIVAERARLEAALDAMPGARRFPSAANFVLVRVPDAPAAFEALKARGILVRNLHGSHPLLAHCLRLTVGTPDENAKLIEALASSLAPHHA